MDVPAYRVKLASIIGNYTVINQDDRSKWQYTGTAEGVTEIHIPVGPRPPGASMRVSALVEGHHKAILSPRCRKGHKGGRGKFRGCEEAQGDGRMEV